MGGQHPLSIALWNFASQWFLVPQGTGIVAIILHDLHYQFPGLETISEIVWVYAIVLLSIFSIIYLLRIFIYPGHVAHELRTNISETSGLSSIGIALTTIMQMVALTLVQQWGPSWAVVAYVLWWIVASMAIIGAMVIPYMHVKVQPPGIMGMSPKMLLPPISLLTAASAGGTLSVYAGDDLSPELHGPMLMVAYLLIGTGLPLSLCYVVIFQARLVSRSGFPKVRQVFEAMIVCGPFGQGSFALLIVGRAMRNISISKAASQYELGTFLTVESAGIIGSASQLGGLMVWGYTTFWWFIATTGIVHAVVAHLLSAEKRSRLSFSMSAWSVVFPMILPYANCRLARNGMTVRVQGVYTNATIELGKAMSSIAFNVWSTILLILLVLIYITYHFFTIKGIITGQLLGATVGCPPEHSTEDTHSHVEMEVI